MKSTSVFIIYNFLYDKETIFNEFNNKSGIYLIHNNVNGKQYVGSAINLIKILATYYFPSLLFDSRYISNFIF